MKKKINLRLQKEVISDLSSDSLNNLRGGDDAGSVLPPTTINHRSCDIYSCNTQCRTNEINLCVYTVDNCISDACPSINCVTEGFNTCRCQVSRDNICVWTVDKCLG